MIINHMKTDPNAGKHARLALLATIVLLAPVLWLIGLVVGIAIEVGQCLIRLVTGAPQNTFKEACLDAAGTSLYFIYYYKEMYK